MKNQMEKKMDNERETLGPFKGYIGILPAIMEKNMENQMETRIIG